MMLFYEMAKKMRFNQKELAFIACKTDFPFDKEGILRLKEKEGYLFKNEVYTERWFRLKGNILFYFKTKDKTSEPAGAIVLERCKVTKQPTQAMKHAFIITFDEDDTQQYNLCGKCTKETDEWIEMITNASYEGLRTRLSSLRKQLMDITGKDPLPDSHPLAQQEPLKPGIGEYSSSSSTANPDETPLLEMCIACNGLSAVEGRLPNAFVEIRTMTPPSVSWTKHAQTEIIEKKSDPYFLTTVVYPSNGTIQDVTRLKLAVFDVIDREKEEMSILGQAVCTIKDITSAPDQKLVLTLTCVDSAASCGTVVILGWQGEVDCRPRSSTEDSVESAEGSLGARKNSSRSMKYIDQILTRSYRFPTTEPGRLLKCLELMGESTLSFKIPIQLLKIYIAEEHQRALELHHLGDLNPDWENARHTIIENHFKLIFLYKNFLRDLVPLQGNTFKASKHKGHKQLPFIPVNLHLQRLRVNDGINEGKVYDVITVGAPVCHTLKFNQGGLRKMMQHLKKEQHVEPEAESKAALLKQSRATLERLKSLISQLCDRLKKSMKSLTIKHILESLANLSDKTNHLLKLRETLLVTESLSSLEKVVPRPHDDESGAESAEWQWNVTAFSKDKAQELSKLVQQTLFVMQTHVTGMIQGAKPPEGQQWNDVILGEIHDVSRATDGLAKEIYLGLVFAQLQEDSRHVMLRYTIKRRNDIVFAHAVTSLVAGFISKLYVNLENQQFWKQMLEIGFLAQFESLLSTNGDEMGMLEDMCVGVQSLTRVKFKIRNCERDDEIPAISGNRSSITVTIPVQEESFHLLPKEIQEGRIIKVIPVMFSQGINEHATLAEKFGDTSLQEYINGDNYSILTFYFQQFKDKFPELCISRRENDPTLDNLMEQLKVDVENRKSKNVDILLHSEEICWRMNGARFTSCKSAKDRTAMAVSLEQVLALKREHGMDPNVFQQSLDAMRSEGTRIENTHKNTGTRKYAFNYWQVMALPRLYRPPPGTYGKNDS